MHELQFMKSVSQFLESTIDDITNSWEENDAIINCYNQIFKVFEEFSTDMKLRALDTWKY